MEQLDDLTLLQQDNAKSHHPFRPEGPVWPSLVGHFKQHIRADGATISQINRNFASYPPGDRHYRGYAQHMGSTLTDPGVDWFAEACRLQNAKNAVRDVLNIIPRCPQAAFQYDLSWDLALSINEVISIVELEPRILLEPLVVLDLGQGWGRLGHVLLTLNPRLTYVACDLPEPLIVAQSNLPRMVPHCQARPYSITRGSTPITRTDLLTNPGAWFVGTHDLSRFEAGTVDVIINAFSFQEMTYPMVDAYFDVIDKLATKLYITQRFAGDVLVRPGEYVSAGQQPYPFRSSWRQVFNRCREFSGPFFEAGFVLH